MLTEPLLFAAWTMHDIVENTDVPTMRVGRGKIQYNPTFIESLQPSELEEVLAFEAMRILLGHPYTRQQPKADLSYSASNLTVQECVRSNLPVPRPRELFGDDSFDHSYFEHYYQELDDRSEEDPATDEKPNPEKTPAEDDAGIAEDGRMEPTPQSDLNSHVDPSRVGEASTVDWAEDDLRQDEITTAIAQANEREMWGSVAGQAKERLRANLTPRVDYRSVLRRFRQSVLSVHRRLTRMKPSRRYGFAQMGSRYELTTRLLFAVDVSGSMSHQDLKNGFSIVNQFFKYGIESIDVIWFDTQIHGDPITMRRARSSIEVIGRGGTDFAPLIKFIDQHDEYDGMIVFTDGEASIPQTPKNRKTRFLWLFNTSSGYQRMRHALRHIGDSAHVYRTPSVTN